MTSYITSGLVCVGLGCILGIAAYKKLHPIAAPHPAQVEVVEKLNTITKTVTRYIDKEGKPVEKETIIHVDRETKTASTPVKQPLNEYRVGALLPAFEMPSAGSVSLTAGTRLFGDVWADAQYSFRHKEITIGLSYEF